MEARHGDGKLIGLYEMIDTLCAVLDNANTANSSWGVTGVTFLNDERFYRAGLYIGAVNVEGRVRLDAVEPSTLDAFVTFHADYDLASPDGAIDATDQVTLPQ